MASTRKAWRLGWTLATLAACASPNESASPSPDGGGFVDPPPDASPDVPPVEDAGADASPPPTLCNDHDPCTVDRYESGACVFAPVEDGRPCDDGNFCTLGDRCAAGVCVPGKTVTGPLASFGSLKAIAGGGMGAIGNRFLSITGRRSRAHLELFERQSGKLATIAIWDGALAYSDPAEMLVRPFANELVALGARGERTLSVMSVQTPLGGATTITERSKPELPGQLGGLAAHGTRIWVCTNDFWTGAAVSFIDASDPDAPEVVGSMPLPNACASVAVSDDGDHVYVNTGAGVRYIDASPLSSGGDPTLSEVIAPSAGTSTSNGYVILRGATLRILKQSDLSLVADIPASGVQAAAVVGDRLFVEGWRKTGSGMEGFATIYGGVGTAAIVKLDEVILETRAFQGDIVPEYRTAIAADGSAVITGDGQRWFDLTTGHFVETRDARLTPFDQLLVAGGSVRVVGHSSSASIDLTNVGTPRFLDGGSSGRAGTLDVRLEESPLSSHLLFGTQALAPRVATGKSWEPAQLPIERWSFGNDGQVQVTGSFRLPNVGSGELFIAGDDLYRFRHAAMLPGVTLLGWPLAALGRDGEVAQPAFELALSTTPLPSGEGPRSAFYADGRARRAVVAAGSNTLSKVTWLDLTTSPPTVLEEVSVDGPADDVRVSGTRAVLSTGLALVWLELGKGVVGRVTPTGNIYVPHVLGFDGKTTYYASNFPNGIGTAVFGSTVTPPPMALTDEPSSLVETSGSLVVGLPSELVTMHPQCE